jgi:carbamate kinase
VNPKIENSFALVRCGARARIGELEKREQIYQGKLGGIWMIVRVKGS